MICSGSVMILLCFYCDCDGLGGGSNAILFFERSELMKNVSDFNVIRVMLFLIRNIGVI